MPEIQRSLKYLKEERRAGIHETKRLRCHPQTAGKVTVGLAIRRPKLLLRDVAHFTFTFHYVTRIIKREHGRKFRNHWAVEGVQTPQKFGRNPNFYVDFWWGSSGGNRLRQTAWVYLSNVFLEKGSNTSDEETGPPTLKTWLCPCKGKKVAHTRLLSVGSRS